MPEGQGYEIGTAWIQAVLSLRGVEKDAAKAGAEAGKAFIASFDEEVGRKSTPLPVPGKPESRKQGTESGGAFADAFTNRVKAALKNLPKAKVGVDATEADAELQHIREKLAALGDVKVGVDLSAAAATAELDRLKARLDELGASSPDVQVRADVAAASAQLAAFQAQVDKLDGSKAEVKVDVDTGKAETAISRLVSDAGKNNRIKLGFDAPDVSSLLPLQNALGLVAAGAVVAAPALFALGSSAGLAASSLVAIIPAAAGAGFAVGTLAAALGGVLGTLKAYQASQKSAAASTANSAAISSRSAATELSNAKAVQSAQDSIADARRHQADVAEQGAERIRSANLRVQDAERSVTSAQEDARRAQQSLNDARRQAVVELQDLQDKLASYALDEEGASIALARAQENAAKVAKDRNATALDQRDAAFQVAEAQARLNQVQKDAKKTETDLAAAKKAGVKGNAGVIKATDDVVSANQRVADAQRTLSESERDVTVARRDAAKSQADAARTVSRAVRDLSDLQAQQAAALKTQTAQTNKASAATVAYAEAYKKLTPAGKTFFKTLLGFGPLIDRLKAAAETATLPGLTKFLLDGKTLFPQVSRGVTLFGRAISDSAASLGEYAKSAIFRKDFASLVDSTSRSTRNLGAAATPLASALTTLATASAPLLERFTAFILRGTKLADTFLLNKQRTGELGAFFKSAGDEMAKWGRIVGNFAGGLLNLFRDANPAGKTLADRLESVSRSFKDWTASGAASEKIRKFFAFFADFDYKRLGAVALTAAKLYATYAAFKVAGSLAKNPFFFLIALAAVKNPEAVSGFVDDVWSAAKPMFDFLSAHPTVFEGFIALLAALRLTAAAKGLPGLLKGIPGLSGILGGGSDGSIAGARDVKSRKPGSPFNPIVTAGGGDSPGAPGGKTGPLAAIGKGLTLVTIAGTIALVSSAIVDKLNGSQPAPLSPGGLKNETVKSPAALGWKGLLGNLLTEKPPTIPIAGLGVAFGPVKAFLTETVPGWATSGFSLITALFQHPTSVIATAGLGTAFAPVRTFFATTVPSWATSGFGVIRSTFEHPTGVLQTGGLGVAFGPVKTFFETTVPSWAKSGFAVSTAVFEHPRVIGTAGLGVAFGGIRSFFLTIAPGWAGAGVTLIARQFDSLKTLLVAPINWIITNVLNRLIGAANFVITKFGGTALDPFPTIGQGAGTSKPAAGGNSGSGGKNIRLASGGIMPGYTPGRDVHTFASPTGGRLDLSGGEAVMRPEWTRAVGPGYVDQLNRAARRGGVSGVRRAMGGPGAFAVGGIIGKIRSAADWGKAGISTLQGAAKGGLRAAVEFLLSPVRASLENPQAGRLFASMTAGAINKMVAGIFGYADAQNQMGDPSGGGGGSAVNIPANVSGKIAAIQSFLRSTDPLPYIWGGTGPGGYDCSGIASAVYGMLTGRGGGHGQRYFTTASNFASLGFRPGTASDFVIGVNPGTHMDGRLGGLPFEAQSTATGIHIGSSATPTARFRQQFYLPGISATGGSKPAQVAKFDSGGYLQPGLNLAMNATGKPEPVFTAAQGAALMANAGGGRAGANITNNVANYGQPITAADVVRAQRQAEALLPIG